MDVARKLAACAIRAPSDARGRATAATSNINALLTGLGALVVLCLVAIVGAIALTDQQARSLAAERERAQLENALATKVADMRGDLTSVTFWDEAVERTAVTFDPGWVDENIGEWLAEFYGVDQSFVLDPRGAVVHAALKGERTDVGTYDRVRQITGPMARRAAAKARNYTPGEPEEHYGSAGADKTRGLDEARFAIVEGRPVLIVVAPLLPDFGRLSRRPSGHYSVVAIHQVDDVFLRLLGGGLLLDGLRLTPPGETGSAEDHLPLAMPGSPAVGELRWRSSQGLGDLLPRILPIAVLMLLTTAVAGMLVWRFVRRSAHQIFVSRFEATHDDLTGLANRRLFTRRLETTLGALGPDDKVALLFIDLDRLKEVNDIWGHAAGDAVIRTSAERIANGARSGLAARLGGDEFVVLLEDGAAHAEAVAARLLEELRRPHCVEETSVVLAGSIGIALAPEHGRTANELMRCADLALYRAKEVGKDKSVVFDHEMDRNMRSRQRLEQDLRDAIDAGLISVVYQPQVCRKSGHVTGTEALARWHHPERGEIPPAVFIPLAEETGLIRRLDRLVLREACKKAVAWTDTTIAVNVSPIELRSPSYAAEVQSVLTETGLPARRLRLEITETALLTSVSAVARTVAELRAMGIRMALDDFGTGYSSLDHLRTLKLDSMKIDRSFVANLATDPDTHALVASIVALGHALGLTVTAEGVETEAQLAILRAAGCDEFQGFLLGRPVEAARVDRLVRRSVPLLDELAASSLATREARST